MSVSSSSSTTARFASWNILADGLSKGEFITDGGDDTCVWWEKRGPRVQAVVEEILNTKKVDILVTQENDHFWSLLHNAKKNLPHLRGVFCVSNLTELTNAEEFLMRRHITDEVLPAKPAKTATPGQTSEYVHELYNQVQFDEHYSSYAEEQVPQEFVDWRMRALGIHGVSTSDSCICPDGLGVFYDSRIMQLVGVHGHYTVICDDVYEYKDKHGFLEFLHLPSQTYFLVAVAHLKSGETATAEQKRTEQMQKLVRILDNTKKHHGDDTRLVPVMLMDSNTNKAYQKVANANDETITTVNDVLAIESLVDVVDERAPCVKMRHTQGGQPRKFGELFVDGIDKCIVPERLADAFHLDDSPLDTFQCIPEQHLVRLSSIRNDKHKREALKQFVIEHQFGDNMRDNCFRSPAVTEHPFGLAPHELCESLLELYPNDRAPSDHPPVVVHCDLAELVQLCDLPDQSPVEYVQKWMVLCVMILFVLALCVLIVGQTI